MRLIAIGVDSKMASASSHQLGMCFELMIAAGANSAKNAERDRKRALSHINQFGCRLWVNNATKTTAGALAEGYGV